MQLVSVLMTAYNREKYIGDAIESVLASSYTNLELIITDDCSSDNTFTIANEYAAKDARVKVYRNEKNLGDYLNRNRAASYASGVYLKYLDSDDTIYPWGIAAMVYCMEKYPHAVFGLMSKRQDTFSPYPVVKTGEAAYKDFFFTNQLLVMGPSGSIIRTDAFRKLNGFSGKNYIGDTELWLRFCQHSDVVCMPYDLIWWRQHEGQQIKEEKMNPQFEENKLLVFQEALMADDCPLNAEDRKTALRNQYNIRARHFVKSIAAGNIREAKLLYRSWKLKPADILRSAKKNKVP